MNWNTKRALGLRTIVFKFLLAHLAPCSCQNGEDLQVRRGPPHFPLSADRRRQKRPGNFATIPCAYRDNGLEMSLETLDERENDLIFIMLSSISVNANFEVSVDF
jgi:hypothetical protein